MIGINKLLWYKNLIILFGGGGERKKKKIVHFKTCHYYIEAIVG